MAATTIRIVPPRLSGWPSGVLARRRPHLLQSVEGANRRPETVDDHVARVDQDPVALPHALDTNTRHPRLFNVFDQGIGNGADMALRSAAGHDHVIADRRF